MKKRVLALVMVLTLMTMGVAYAAWSQTVTVQGSISTGKLEVETSAEAFTFVDNIQSGLAGEIVESSPDVVGGVEVEGNEVVVDISKFYPGVTATSMVTFENTGTMPVKMKLLEEAVDPVPGLTISFAIDGVVFEGVDGLRGALNNRQMYVDEILEIGVIIAASIDLDETTLLENDTESYSYSLPFEFRQYNVD